MEIVQGRDNFVEANGLKLHYVEWGNGEAPPIVMLHGIASFAHIWDFIAPAFVADYRVVSLDWRGHGDSGWAEPDSYTYEDYVSDLAGLISALDLRNVTIVGHSLGGLVSLYYASQQPEKVRAIVAADFRTGVSAEELEQARQQSLRPHRELATAEELIDRFGASLAPTAASREVIHHLGRYAIKRAMSGQWIFRFDRATLAISPIEPWSALRNVRVPVLAMRGGESPLMSREAIMSVGESIPGVRVVEIPGAYHHLFLDKPDDFVREVKSFLSGLRG